MGIRRMLMGMAILKKYLKPTGWMILTVPFGRASVAYPAHRIYDRPRFSRLTSGFRILDMKFFGPIDRADVYRPCSEQEVYSVHIENPAVACCLLEKEQ